MQVGSLIFYGILALLVGTFLKINEAAVLVDDEESAGEGQIWAVLVAGSRGYYNYRHQADLCHAYQVLHTHGVPDENIVVMMFDDIANNEMNPMKGIIINNPNGTDVYNGVPKDYIGTQVTPHNFLNILLGKEEAMRNIGSGKVIKSGPNDRIFINLVDHGGVGIFCFPDEYLFAPNLTDVLTQMYHNKMFKEMVLYVESCESGSLFDTLLPDDLNVLAITASNAVQSSYACYYDKKLGAYLGDVFSVNWMEDSDHENLNKETLYDQFRIVASETTSSNVSKYGDMDLEVEPLSDYMGAKSIPYKTTFFKPSSEKPAESQVDSRDVPLMVLERRLHEANSLEDAELLKREIINLHRNRKFVDNKMEEILLSLTYDNALMVDFMTKPTAAVIHWDCYGSALQAFHKYCFNLGLNAYVLRYVGVFSKLCDHGFSEKEISTAILNACTHPSVFDIN